MSFSPYKSTQIDAAECLLELFCPSEQSLDKILAAFADALEDIDDEEAPIYLLLHQALGKNGSYFALQEDSAALIESLSQLGEQWGANLLFGARDWEGSYTEYSDSADLLAIAALELRAYELCLWQWEGGEDILSGFISRLEDADLVEKLVLKCEADCRQVEEWEVI